MSDHLVVYADQLVKPEEAAIRPGQPVHEATGRGPLGKQPEMVGSSSSMEAKVVVEEENEEVPLIGVAECRICQEDDSLNNLESPCACSGSLKYAHRKCVQHWCNEKGDITCEICHQPYQPGYTAPPRPHVDETAIDIRGVWQISGTPLDMHDPRLLAITEAERQFFQAEYDDYNSTSNGGAAFCRSAALILMALLLLRQALSVTDGEGDGDGDEDASTFFSLSLLRVAGFLLPCYIMIWAISILQQRRQRQEAAALAATQFAIVVQSAQSSRGLLVASAAPAVASLATPHREQV
ncbi:involved in mRNA turnover and stability [Olea europaea subsp. europaea]|uniref:Involved in mRNA turnover and stability n=1 Tax=Olea europaea subsp. europaea TaxID=158383 RepID=A0A8S0RXI2_OLEEU|nr:involved in mRNA turnover and stability [Olea europaea subsp. europaea]